MVSPNEPLCYGRLRSRAGRSPDAAIVEPHRILGLSRHETDTVQIILAAQIRLRRWRRLDPAAMPAKRRQRVHEIVGAREAMMRRAMLRLSASQTDQSLIRTV